MKEGFILILILIWLALSIGFCLTEGRRSRLGLIGSIVACILITPLGAVFLVWLLPPKDPIGCPYCDNKYNEAEYCGICGKNILGERKEGLHYRNMKDE